MPDKDTRTEEEKEAAREKMAKVRAGQSSGGDEGASVQRRRRLAVAMCSAGLLAVVVLFTAAMNDEPDEPEPDEPEPDEPEPDEPEPDEPEPDEPEPDEPEPEPLPLPDPPEEPNMPSLWPTPRPCDGAENVVMGTNAGVIVGTGIFYMLGDDDIRPGATPADQRRNTLDGIVEQAYLFVPEDVTTASGFAPPWTPAARAQALVEARDLVRSHPYNDGRFGVSTLTDPTRWLHISRSYGTFAQQFNNASSDGPNRPAWFLPQACDLYAKYNNGGNGNGDGSDGDGDDGDGDGDGDGDDSEGLPTCPEVPSPTAAERAAILGELEPLMAQGLTRPAWYPAASAWNPLDSTFWAWAAILRLLEMRGKWDPGTQTMAPEWKPACRYAWTPAGDKQSDLSASARFLFHQVTGLPL